MLRGFYLSVYLNGAPAPRDVIDAILSLSITQAAGQTSGFQLQLSTAKRSRLVTEYLPSGMFDPITTRVQFVVTLGGQPHVLFDGLIARQELGPSSEPGAGTLTLTGEDLSLAMNLVELTGIPYTALTMEAIVALNLAPFLALGVIPEIIPSVFVDVPNPLERYPMHVGTSLSFIKYLAAQVGYVFYVAPTRTLGVNRAYWGPEIRWGEVQPALTINSDAHTNVDALSFSYDGTQAKLFVFLAQLPNTTISIPIPVPGTGVLRPQLGARQPIPFKLELLPDSHRLGPIRAAGLALAKAAEAADCVTGQGSLNVLRYGRILESRSLVDVRGAGRAYDGTYYVKSVTHTIKRGEYKQSFALVRDGTVATTSRVAI